ncbi:hypothetical protein [Christiangramia sp. SM2212]|uniref:DUF4352 domain-containing protein n=1 Tax=Christiangramia sediminicola TaxID=3073267 RepID=A0ABU1EU75_9FLAO|nr:hypothetical protein [Christiangramia sp. SM2212]MDR5591931.1 hypothetical protein [Christiangramia sp. SM2212]
MKATNFKLSFGGALIAVLLNFLILSCKSNEEKDEDSVEETEETKQAEEKPEAQSMTIVTNAMEFKAKDEWKAGWTTIKYRNNSNETHFILFDKYPEGKTIEDAEREVGPAFQEGMDFLNKGEFEKANEAFGKLPEWFQQVEYTGGVGLISAKSTAQSTIYLEPGTYIIECYVKMANGVFHNTQGMAMQINVIEPDSSEVDIMEDYTINVSGIEGITFNERPSAGEKTFKVEFGEQKVHENYVMSDVHLVWVDEGADISKLNAWMNWADPKGLQTPSPEGFKFLGGMQEMKQGGIGYFTAELRPGNYALISEVPDPQSKGMLKTFKVQ